MKYQTDFRHPEKVALLSKKIAAITSQPWKIMEICGGQTHAIAKFGLLAQLPPHIELVHGPGCPVCVTPQIVLDHAITLAKRPDVLFCTFGDMLRVPGSTHDLLHAKALGAHIHVIYTPLEVLHLAKIHPDKKIVLLAVGFETTAPTFALTLQQAANEKLTNLFLLYSLVRVPPAMEFILNSPHNQVQGFLAAGHVCTIMGIQEYIPIAEKYRVPIIITGFEPVDILQGIYHCIAQLEKKTARVENHYRRSVYEKGNPFAQKALTDVFSIIDTPWRGIGLIPQSGLALSEKYRAFDAFDFFGLSLLSSCQKQSVCISGDILQGLKKPFQCPAFGKSCTPLSPLGAPMVSTEGACAAYYRYIREDNDVR